MAARTQRRPARFLRAGVLRSRQLERLGYNRPMIAAMVADGELLRVARGVYISASHELTAVACARVPEGVICLLSALVVHGLTVQNPSVVWMAIAPAARKPAIHEPPLRIVRYSGVALSHGLMTLRIEGVRVRVTSVAKTVADLFKYRNKIGIDVAVEARVPRVEGDEAVLGGIAVKGNLEASVLQRLLNLSRARGEEYEQVLVR